MEPSPPKPPLFFSQKNHAEEIKRVSWFQEIENLMKAYCLVEYQDMAKLLDVSQSKLSACRAGDEELNVLTKAKILHMMGYSSLEDALAILCHEERDRYHRRREARLLKKRLGK